MEGIKSKESKEAFKGSIGFDFIFVEVDGEIQIKCLEINGHDSGIRGLNEIYPQNEDVEKRILENDERNEKHKKLLEFASEIDKGRAGEFPDLGYDENIKRKVIDFVKRSQMKVPLFTNANRNPLVVEEICEDKLETKKYIPESLSIKNYTSEEEILGLDDDYLFILKPRYGISGRGIYILGKERLLRALKSNEKEGSNLFERYVVEDMLESRGCDTALLEGNDSISSLRMLFDFSYLKNGKINIDNYFCYNRVSEYAREDTEKNLMERYVVSKALGAVSYPASEREVDMSYKAALEILENLIPVYKKYYKV